ncbi:hypothetical protein ACLB2K_054885 [Fragaria x ananassa]
MSRMTITNNSSGEESPRISEKIIWWSRSITHGVVQAVVLISPHASTVFSNRSVCLFPFSFHPITSRVQEIFLAHTIACRYHRVVHDCLIVLIPELQHRQRQEAIQRTLVQPQRERTRSSLDSLTETRVTRPRQIMFDSILMQPPTIRRYQDHVKARIRGMPTVMAIDDEVCAVCLEGFESVFKEDEGSAGKQTPCGNLFHQTCISKWLTNANYNSTCPTCRCPL